MKLYQSGRFIFRKMVQMCSYFATTCTIRGTRGAKLPADVTFSGRSMVEMLGVLAIIGVLSVGAIAGYSKAMMKYKLNKQAEQISYYIGNALIYSDLFSQASTHYTLATYYIKMNIVPTEMIKEDSVSKNAFYDVFGNDIRSTYVNYPTASYIEHNIWLANKADASSIQAQCINILNIAKEHSHELYSVFSHSYNESQTQGTYLRYFGDAYCTSGRTCIKDLTLKSIETFCDNCTDKNPELVGCRITLQHKYKSK